MSEDRATYGDKKLILFEEVAKALENINFGEDLSLIITETPGKKEMSIMAGQAGRHITQSGEYDPLRELIIIKRMAFYLSEIEAFIKTKAIEEASKHVAGKRGTFEFFGGKIQVKKEPDKWRYEDGFLEHIDEKIDSLKKRRKAIEAINQTGTYLDPETGTLYKQAVKIAGDGDQISITL